MYKKDNLLGFEEFEDFVQIVGNRYKAIKLITNEARTRSSRNVFISDSVLLTWIVTGKKPVKYPTDIAKLLRKSKRIEDILMYVSNQKIVKSVTLSLGLSNSKNHLIYRYDKSLTDYEKIRVRILTNIIWYERN